MTRRDLDTVRVPLVQASRSDTVGMPTRFGQQKGSS
jgi:hypothetical protein